MAREQHGMWPHRYSGVVAWRGVLDVAKQPQLYQDLRAEYPHLGDGISFDLSAQGLAVTFTIPGPKVNWLWCGLGCDLCQTACIMRSCGSSSP